MKYKLAIDIHGICDQNPSFFKLISRLIVNDCGEIHIVTGMRKSDGAVNDPHTTKLM